MKLPKERKTDRVFILKVKDGEKSKASTGLIDPRLFTGDNKLHAVMDLTNRLWSLHYEHGVVPPPFKQQFTNFSTAHVFVAKYFETRNIEIAEIVD